MTVGSTHTKNPLADWDIAATAKADTGEKIARAQIVVNGSTEYDKTFDPAINSWQTTLLQKGEYPGDNTVEVIVTDDKGEDTTSDDEWS
jgi:hypothetical protein